MDAILALNQNKAAKTARIYSKLTYRPVKMCYNLDVDCNLFVIYCAKKHFLLEITILP